MYALNVHTDIISTPTESVQKQIQVVKLLTKRMEIVQAVMLALFYHQENAW